MNTNLLRSLAPTPRRMLMAAVLALSGTGTLHAADVTITAEFKPNLNDPNQRRFTNTTPWSGVCAGPHLQTCISGNVWSIDTKIRGTKNAVRQNNYGPNGFFIGMPGPKAVTVFSEDGLASYTLSLKIVGAAMRYTDQDRDGDAYNFWSSNLNCNRLLQGYGAYTVMRLMLRRDGSEGAGSCAGQWMATNNYAIRELDFVYALETPEPLKMRSGIYTGVVSYTFGGTGEGTDFDLGNGVELTDSVVNVYLRLEVQHAFQLDVPAGSDRAILMPKGGWARWSDHGVAPKALEREIPFSLSSSGQFSVFTQCQYPQSDGRCGIRNTTVASDDAPLDVSLTMPGFRDADTGERAVDIALHGPEIARVFTADEVVIGRPSRLRFAVNGAPVQAMLQHPGSQYRGNVTVIFDADP